VKDLPCLPTAGLLAQGQYDLDPLPPFPDHVQYTHYSDQIGKRPACHQAFFSPTLPRCAQLSQGWGEVGPWEPQGGVPRAGGLPDPPVHIHLSFQTTRTTMIIKVKGWGQDRWTGSWVESPCRAGGGGMGRREQTPLSSPVAEVTPRPPEEQFQFQSQQQVQQEVIPAPTLEPGHVETEPTEPGPLDCREEQYPCTRLYSIHKPCKQCLNEVCFYSLRRVYVVNKEICVRTVCAHEELLRADLCRDKFSKCGVMASSGLCQSVAASCARSCGGC
uniref:Microfibril associated protein 2 n=1 Tax=Sus scrofa TaxID=9823 RepID=A0A8W4FIB5_PIG